MSDSVDGFAGPSRPGGRARRPAGDHIRGARSGDVSAHAATV